MTSIESVSPAVANHVWLIAQFASVVGRYKPASILDVGCGAGLLMKTLHGAGIKISAIDQAGPKLDALREEGFDVQEGTAYELPFEADSIDWITMRHVPHHLEDPAKAFAELLRVAKTGAFIAEPYFNRSIPSQRATDEYESWEKIQQRKGGMYHAENYSIGELMGLLPEGWEAEYEVDEHTCLRLRPWSLEEAEEQARGHLKDSPDDPAQSAELEDLLTIARKDGLSFNGSKILVVKRK